MQLLSPLLQLLFAGLNMFFISFAGLSPLAEGLAKEATNRNVPFQPGSLPRARPLHQQRTCLFQILSHVQNLIATGQGLL